MVDRPSSASHRIDDEVSETRRATVRAMEDILYQSFDVLDHGFLRVIDYMGDDGAVVQAARVSYGKGTKAIQEDRGLIRYLMKHWHTTPFEMCEIKLHIKLPIFVARQWVRHRTANINEYSARYSIIDKEFYIPLPENLAAQSKLNRQGREVILGAEEAQEVIRLLRSDAERSYQHYRWMLNEDDAGQRIDPNRLGLTRELARMGLSINMYTQWYWKTDLHNLLRFLRLRSDAHAQYEIRVYADQLLKMVERWVPMTYEAFMEYQMKAVTLSATSVDLLRRMLQGEQITFEESGLSKREWDELVYTFHLRASDS